MHFYKCGIKVYKQESYSNTVLHLYDILENTKE